VRNFFGTNAAVLVVLLVAGCALAAGDDFLDVVPECAAPPFVFTPPPGWHARPVPG